MGYIFTWVLGNVFSLFLQFWSNGRYLVLIHIKVHLLRDVYVRGIHLKLVSPLQGTSQMTEQQPNPNHASPSSFQLKPKHFTNIRFQFKWMYPYCLTAWLRVNKHMDRWTWGWKAKYWENRVIIIYIVIDVSIIRE